MSTETRLDQILALGREIVETEDRLAKLHVRMKELVESPGVWDGTIHHIADCKIIAEKAGKPVITAQQKPKTEGGVKGVFDPIYPAQTRPGCWLRSEACANAE